MLHPGQPLPSTEESLRETNLRLKVLNNLKTPIETFADALILCGSLAYGKNWSVRKESDIDLLVLVEPEKIDAMFDLGIFPHSNWNDQAARLFRENKVQQFSLIQHIEGIKVEFHFWNKESQYRASRLEIQSITRLTSNPISSSTLHYDFFGVQRHVDRPIRKDGEYYLQQYPIYAIANGHFVLYDPLINLILAPEIIFTRDSQIYKNIDVMWTKVIQQLIRETNGKVNLDVVSIEKSQPCFEFILPALQKSILERTKEELIRLGAEIS